MKIVLDIPDDWDENKCIQINADIEGQGQYKVKFQMPPHDAQFFNMKDYYLDSYETYKRDLEQKYNLEVNTLTKSEFDNEEILDEPSKLITTEEDDVDITEEIDMINMVISSTEKLEIEKLFHTLVNFMFCQFLDV